RVTEGIPAADPRRGRVARGLGRTVAGSPGVALWIVVGVLCAIVVLREAVRAQPGRETAHPVDLAHLVSRLARGAGATVAVVVGRGRGRARPLRHPDPVRLGPLEPEVDRSEAEAAQIGLLAVVLR